MKARALVLLGGLNTHLFANQAYLSLHLDYPILMPSIEATDFRFIGHPEAQVMHVQFWLLLVGFLVAAYELLRDRVPQTLLWPALLVAGTAPVLIENLTSADADMPVAIFFSLAALAGWRYIVGAEPRDAWLFGLLAGAGLATKVEGEVFIGLLCVIVLVFAVLTRRRLAPLGLAFAWCLISIIPWQLWISHHGVHSVTPLRQTLSPAFLWSRVDRIGPWLHWFADQSVKADWAAILPIAAATALVVLASRRGWPSAVFAVVVIVVLFLGLTWGFLARPLGIQEILRNAGRRTLSTLLLVSTVLVPVLGAGLSRRQTAEQQPASERASWPWSRRGRKAATSTAESS
jgi:hypothetical protein